MKHIKIKFTGFSSDFNPTDNDFINILRKRYEVELSEKPDYLFYSNFDREYLKYDCIKIFYTGECLVPDFNLCDYALAFENMHYEDRYLRVPLYELFQYRKDYQLLLDNKIEHYPKSSFCSIVVSNDQGMPERMQIVDLLNKYKRVDSGGKYRNNVGGPVKDKKAFDSQHKFSICFENCQHLGYTTEKIVQAFAADTIPIYLGNPIIAQEFNTRAFVNVIEFASLHDAVNRIIEIDQDDKLYETIKAEPIITGARRNTNELESFLYNIFDQPVEKARRRPKNTYCRYCEEQVKIFDTYHSIIGKHIKKIRALIRRFKNNAL